jgi:non-homologous end joining protein Ku
LAPSKGAEKPYRLMAEALDETGRVAIAQLFFTRRKPRRCSLRAKRSDDALQVFCE